VFSIFSKRSKVRPQQPSLSPAETELITKAVALFRDPAGFRHDDIFRKLVAAGAPRRDAARLVEFLPSAYCRVVFPEVHYSEKFQRRLPDGSMSAEQSLSAEPMWNAAVTFARGEIERGTAMEELFAVADQSAELGVIADLVRGGSQRQYIHLTPAALMWPEDGPED